MKTATYSAQEAKASTVSAQLTDFSEKEPSIDSEIRKLKRADGREDVEETEDGEVEVARLKITFDCGKGNDRMRQRGGRGRDRFRADGGGGSDRMRQRGGRGRDRLRAHGNGGNDRIRQSGGRGRDNLRANGGRGNDRIRQKAVEEEIL